MRFARDTPTFRQGARTTMAKERRNGVSMVGQQVLM
jgi:hypothetical protein